MYMRCGSAALAASVLLAGCGATGNLIGGNAPGGTNYSYPETRVQRVMARCEGGVLQPAFAHQTSDPARVVMSEAGALVATTGPRYLRRELVTPYAPVPGGCAAIGEGDSFSVIVNDIFMPKETEFFGDGRFLPSDVAVLLDVDFGSAERAKQPLLVWFQKHYRSRSRLNMADLIVANQDLASGRETLRLRFRIVKINDETTKDLLDGPLKQAGGAATALAGALATPLALPAVQAGLLAAQVILASRKNEVVLDFTLGMFPEGVTAAAPAHGLVPIQVGTFAVAGEARAGSVSGQPQLVFNETLNVFEHGTTPDSEAIARYEGPVFVFSILRGDMDVPKVVGALSTEWGARLSAAGGTAESQRATTISQIAVGGPIAVAAAQFASRPKAHELRGLLTAMQRVPSAGAAGDAWTAGAHIVRRATGCSVSDPTGARAVLRQIKTTDTIASDSYRVEATITCP